MEEMYISWLWKLQDESVQDNSQVKLILPQHKLDEPKCHVLSNDLTVKVSHLLVQDISLNKQHGEASICYEHETHAAKNNKKHQAHVSVSTPFTTLYFFIVQWNSQELCGTLSLMIQMNKRSTQCAMYYLVI